MIVVEGLMIGGFALVAPPAEYGVTRVKTFIVSHDGVVAVGGTVASQSKVTFGPSIQF
jgi:hypothetical protein